MADSKDSKDPKDSKESKPWWESASAAVGAILVPVAVAFVGSIYTSAVKNREVEGQFVEMAVSILQQQPTEESQPLRSWAVSVLDKYSGVEMSQSTRDSLIERNSLPKEVGLVNAPAGINVRDKPDGDPIAGADANTRLFWIAGSETTAEGGEVWVQLVGGGWVMKKYLVPLKPAE